MMKFLLVILLAGCSLLGKSYQITERQKEGMILHISMSSFGNKSKEIDTVSNKAQAIWQGKYWKVTGAGPILKNTSVASVALWVKLKRTEGIPQDLIAISVGGIGEKKSASRISIRLQDKTLIGIIRANDEDQAQNITTHDMTINTDKWYHVAMTVDYATNTVLIYLNGISQELQNQPTFSQPHTSDTDSISIALGSEDDGSEFFADGDLREVIVWRRMLSVQELKDLYQGSKIVL